VVLTRNERHPVVRLASVMSCYNRWDDRAAAQMAVGKETNALAFNPHQLRDESRSSAGAMRAGHAADQIKTVQPNGRSCGGAIAVLTYAPV
jgi:hypothetical protein